MPFLETKSSLQDRREMIGRMLDGDTLAERKERHEKLRHHLKEAATLLQITTTEMLERINR